jgi:aspartate/methionine/tyrosine aminotransferase
MTHKHSDYMHWAKTQGSANHQVRFNLSTSGVGAFPMTELNFDCARLQINGNNSYGFPPLQQAIASEYGVPPECVVTSQGTSMANYLAMATLLNPGDEVVVEHPTYGLLLDALEYLGASIKRFSRRPEEDWAVTPHALRAAVTPKTRLVVFANLHNPTSVLTPESAVREAAEIAASIGATLLVDEVYLDAVYENRPRSAFLLAPNVVITSSLTKVYGVSGLRCGWIFAQPDLAWKMRRLNDLFAATPAHPAEILSLAVFEKLAQVRERARAIVEADRRTLHALLAAHPEIACAHPAVGTTAFLKLPVDSVDRFLDRLRTQFETSAVPGRFFEYPDYFRIGMGVDHAIFAEGLNRIASAIAA